MVHPQRVINNPMIVSYSVRFFFIILTIMYSDNFSYYDCRRIIKFNNRSNLIRFLLECSVTIYNIIIFLFIHNILYDDDLLYMRTRTRFRLLSVIRTYASCSKLLSCTFIRYTRIYSISIYTI